MVGGGPGWWGELNVCGGGHLGFRRQERASPGPHVTMECQVVSLCIWDILTRSISFLY